MMKEKVLVTGGTSFIGRHLIRRLFEEDVNVTVLARDASRVPPDWAEKGEVVEGDVRNKESLSKLFWEGSIIFHLAGETERESLFYDINVRGTRNVVDLAARAGTKHFIHLSSVGVFGYPKRDLIDENVSCSPVNEYEKSKYEGEKILAEYHERYSFPVTVLRPSTVFGEESKTGSFLRWMKSIKNRTFRFIGNKAFANYIYVGDVVEALLLISKGNRSGKEVFILSDTKPMREFVHAAAAILRVEIPETSVPRWAALWITGALAPTMRFFGKTFPLTVSRVKALTDQRIFSAERIKKKLGFEPTFGIVEGLRKTLRWYEREGLL